MSRARGELASRIAGREAQLAEPWVSAWRARRSEAAKVLAINPADVPPGSR